MNTGPSMNHTRVNHGSQVLLFEGTIQVVCEALSLEFWARFFKIKTSDIKTLLSFFWHQATLLCISNIQKVIRKRIDEDDPAFKALVKSIRSHRILQPPIVAVITGENSFSSILLVGGEWRLKAAKAAGYHSLKCVVRIFDNQSTHLTASVSENMNRRDLEYLVFKRAEVYLFRNRTAIQSRWKNHKSLY